MIAERGAALEYQHREEILDRKQGIGDSLKKIRQDAGIAIAGMSALISMGRGTLGVAENPRNQKRTLSFEKLEEIATAYQAAINAKAATERILEQNDPAQATPHQTPQDYE